jgi:hypothetical protein
MDGDGAMADSDGAAAGAEEAAGELDPPQAVRLSMAAAAIPATAKVVRLMVCISGFSFVVATVAACGP